MKEYKLKKEFPSSKVGDIWFIMNDGFMSPKDKKQILIFGGEE